MLGTYSCVKTDRRHLGTIIQGKFCIKNSQKFAVTTGLEPATPCVTGKYADQLRYATMFAEMGGSDPHSPSERSA